MTALCAFVSISCANRGNGEAKGREVSRQEQMVRDELDINFQTFLEDTKKLRNLPFVQGPDGTLELDGKAKMVRPDYLLDPGNASSMVTLSQKYRYLAMLKVDCAVASLYDMPLTAYRSAMARLAVETGDSVIRDIAALDSLPGGEQMSKFLDEEYSKGREYHFWESVAASLVEQIYICTMDIDRFLAMFDDNAAADLTYDFVLLHNGVSSLLEYNPDMRALDNVLLPLYAINAICVDELRGQLVLLREDISNARNFLSRP